MNFSESWEILQAEDVPVTPKDVQVLARLRQYTPEEIFAGLQALAEAFPQLVAAAAHRRTFAGYKPFDLPPDEPQAR